MQPYSLNVAPHSCCAERAHTAPITRACCAPCRRPASRSTSWRDRALGPVPPLWRPSMAAARLWDADGIWRGAAPGTFLSLETVVARGRLAVSPAGRGACGPASAQRPGPAWLSNRVHIGRSNQCRAAAGGAGGRGDCAAPSPGQAKGGRRVVVADCGRAARRGTARDTFAATLWQLIRGAAHVSRPPGPAPRSPLRRRAHRKSRSAWIS